MSDKVVRLVLFVLISGFFFYIFRNNDFSKLAEQAQQLNPETQMVYFYGFLDYLFFPAAKLYAGYVLSGTVVNILFSGVVPSEYSAHAVGEINYVDFSGVRVNGVPMAEAKVTYLGMEKVFSPLPKRFRIHFDKGDSVVIAHHPDDFSQSVIDIDASIAAQKRVV